MQIPIIDISNIDDKALRDIDMACRDHGFFNLVGHGLNDLIDEVLSQTKLFFDAPQALKEEVRKKEDEAFGYYDREITKKKRDVKEVFDYQRDTTPINTLGGLTKEDLWLSNEDNRLTEHGLEKFESTLKRFFSAQTELAERVMAVLCQALGEDGAKLNDLYGDAHTSAARLNYYPDHDPVPSNERDSLATLGEVALGEHTDPNGVTLLYQDDAGGLQALSDSEGWIDIPPQPHSFVINIGDMMQAWSNDRYKAAIHRVLKVPKDTYRISLPFFYMPKSGAVIKPIVSNEQAKFKDIVWDEYVFARIEDNYSVVDREEMQITEYRY